MQSILVRCIVWCVSALGVALPAAQSQTAEHVADATSRKAWNRKLKKIDRIYDDVRKASRNGDSETRRKAFQRLKDYRVSLEQEQRERVRILGRNEIAWTRLQELEDSIQESERAFNENVDNASQRLKRLIVSSRANYKTEHDRWRASTDVREREYLANRKYQIAAMIDRMCRYSVLQRYVLTSAQSKVLARLQREFGKRDAFNADPELIERLTAIGQHRNAAATYARWGNVTLPKLDPPVIPKYYPATNKLELNLALHHGLMQDARREIGCLLCLDLNGRQLRLHRNGVEKYFGGQSAREIEMAVETMIQSQPGLRLPLGIAPSIDIAWKGRQPSSTHDTLMTNLTYRFNATSSGHSSGTMRNNYRFEGQGGRMDLGIDSDDVWNLLLAEHHQPISTTLRIQSRPSGSFEIAIEGSNNLTIEQGSRGDFMIECSGQDFEKKIQADDYIQAYYENPTVFEEYVLVILDHIGMRLPLHRFHPEVIHEVHRQREESGPLPERASKEETRAMLQRLGDDRFHVRTAAFDELLNDLSRYRDMLRLPSKGLSFDVATRLKNARAFFYESVLPEELFVKQMELLGSEEYLRLVNEQERR